VTVPLIVHVIYRLDFGGLENGLVNVINGLPEGKYRHAIVCLAGFNPRFKARIRSADVDVMSLDKKLGKDLPAYFRLYNQLRRMRPAIVHTRNIGTLDMQWVAALAGAKARVHGEHGWDAADPRGLNPKMLMIRRFCKPVVHKYLAMSKDIASWLRGTVGISAAAVEQIYNGVDTSKFNPSGAVPQDFPWRDSATPRVVFGTVGRLDPVKNQLALLEAFAKLRSQLPARSVGLVIAGHGPMGATLAERAQTLGLTDSLWMPGARDDVADIMRSFDVFVLPSINEGISNTLLEAMASGKPVIAARVGGNPELVVTGKHGHLYEAADADALLMAMAAYYESPVNRTAHGHAARQHTEENFSIEAMVSRYESFYDSFDLGSKH
jgi:sugar transferase (PEP-CTERM/EpsH1 system associated)